MKPEFLFSFVCTGIADIKGKKAYLGVAHYFSSPEYPATFENHMTVTHWLLGTEEGQEKIQILSPDGVHIFETENPIPKKTIQFKTLERPISMKALSIKSPCQLTVKIFFG